VNGPVIRGAVRLPFPSPCLSSSANAILLRLEAIPSGFGTYERQVGVSFAGVATSNRFGLSRSPTARSRE
jgi:hypothetical protein